MIDSLFLGVQPNIGNQVTMSAAQKLVTDRLAKLTARSKGAPAYL